MQRTAAARSITPRRWFITSLISITSYFLAAGFNAGSESYTPSIDLAERIISASISIARSTVDVSVEKYGCPVPPAKNTAIPFEKYLFALSFEKSFVNEPHSNGVSTFVIMPAERKISETYMQFITVANMPIWSAFVRSIFSLVRPRQKLPPPVTIPTSIPASTSSLTCLATPRHVASSNPVLFGPARASPLNFNKILLYSAISVSCQVSM